ncbi:MAG: hypothetical protein K8R35_02760 [Bacteroidales bacterium]|nr:hypothetical protein [Bacteroidales bacterium]
MKKLIILSVLSVLISCQSLLAQDLNLMALTLATSVKIDSNTNEWSEWSKDVGVQVPISFKDKTLTISNTLNHKFINLQEMEKNLVVNGSGDLLENTIYIGYIMDEYQATISIDKFQNENIIQVTYYLNTNRYRYSCLDLSKVKRD